MAKRIFRFWVPILLTALLWAQAGISLSDLRKAALAGDLPTAERLAAAWRARNPAVTPQLLEVISWVGRAAVAARNWDKAERYAREAYEGSQKLLERRPLDADKALPLALGAAIEVLAAVQDARGDRAGALEFLRAEHGRYKGSSMEARIQKNILLLSLEGKPAPPLVMPQWIGEKPKALADLQDRVVLLFFWAHWCGDCKRQFPDLVRLHHDFGGRGLTIIAPTQLYGYAARGEPATPEQEMQYLRTGYQQEHPIPSWMTVPVSAENFLKFGVSTTPTLVVMDRQGIVRLYHPGTLPYKDLAALIQPLLPRQT
jgi:thiol-disulfide isomerase/thioredoxin